jgi:hypothetical protein
MNSGTVKSRFPSWASADFGDGITLGEADKVEVFLTDANVLRPGIPISMLVAALQLCQYNIQKLIL